MVAITDILVEIITMVNVCQGKINQNFKIDTIKQGSIMSVILSIYICLPQCSDRSSLSFWLSVCLSFCCPLSVCLSGSLIHLTDCSLIICLSVNLSVYNCFFFHFVNTDFYTPMKCKLDQRPLWPHCTQPKSTQYLHSRPTASNSWRKIYVLTMRLCCLPR